MVVRNLKILINTITLALAFALVNCAAEHPQRKVSDSSEEDEEPEEEEEEEEYEEQEEEVQEAPESNEPEKFDCGGDRVQQSSYDEVSSCHEKGRFYDRSDGSCAKIKLAKIDCSEKGLRAKMPEDLEEDFKDALKDELDGYEVDQCIDCPPDGDNELCEISGKYKTGTVIFMGLEDGKNVKTTKFHVPGRPYQAEDDSVGATCDIEEEDEDEDEDDEEATDEEEDA